MLSRMFWIKKKCLPTRCLKNCAMAPNAESVSLTRTTLFEVEASAFCSPSRWVPTVRAIATVQAKSGRQWFVAPLSLDHSRGSWILQFGSPERNFVIWFWFFEGHTHSSSYFCQKNRSSLPTLKSYQQQLS